MAAAAASSDGSDGPVLTVINNCVRNLRKKLKQIAKTEISIGGEGIQFNKEQEQLLHLKPSIHFAIEKLENLRQSLTAAVAKEIDLAMMRQSQVSEEGDSEEAEKDEVGDSAAPSSQTLEVSPARVINKRVRVLRDKLKRMTTMEKSVTAGKQLSKQQEDFCQSRPSVTFAIQELERVRQSVTAAETLALKELLSLIYFAHMFDVESQSDFNSNVVTRTYERKCCLLNDYNGDDHANVLLGETDLNMISMMGKLLISRPVDSGSSHENALQRCIQHAKLWLEKSELPIDVNPDVTYLSLGEKLTKIMRSKYVKSIPEMKHTTAEGSTQNEHEVKPIDQYFFEFHNQRGRPRHDCWWNSISTLYLKLFTYASEALAQRFGHGLCHGEVSFTMMVSSDQSFTLNDPISAIPAGSDFRDVSQKDIRDLKAYMVDILALGDIRQDAAILPETLRSFFRVCDNSSILKEIDPKWVIAGPCFWKKEKTPWFICKLRNILVIGLNQLTKERESKVFLPVNTYVDTMIALEKDSLFYEIISWDEVDLELWSGALGLQKFGFVVRKCRNIIEKLQIKLRAYVEPIDAMVRVDNAFPGVCPIIWEILLILIAQAAADGKDIKLYRQLFEGCY